MQRRRVQQRRVCVAPSLPRGNRLVARTKTSPGFGRSSSPSRVTPVVLSRSQLARYSGGGAPGGPPPPFPPSPINYWVCLWEEKSGRKSHPPTANNKKKGEGGRGRGFFF